MDLLNQILQKAISLGATDVHLAPDVVPVYRISRKLFYDDSKFPLSKMSLVQIVEDFYKERPNLEKDFEERRQLDVSHTYGDHRFRINISLTKGIPTFSIRIIPNTMIDVSDLGLKDIINKMKKINSGLILLTGKVHSGKSTTLNAFVQELNKEVNKKIVTLEDPIEYEHKSNKCIIIQKEIGRESDVLSYYDGLINLLREDADIAILGEIRDKRTMDVALDLSESGGLVIGTLHTRSCGETLERIISMYPPADQATIKNTVSSVLKMVVSQKLVVDTEGKLLMIPEIMMVNHTIAALIRQEKFSVGDLEDSIHAQRDIGSLSFEYSLADLYSRGKIDMETVKANADENRMETIKNLILTYGGNLDDVDF